MKPILLNSHLLSLRPEKHQKVQRTKLKRHFTFLFVCHHLKCFLKTLKFCRDVFSSSSKAQMRLFFCFNCWWTERSTEACKIKPLGICELCKDSTKRPEYHKADIIKSSLMIPWIWFVCPVSHLKKKKKHPNSMSLWTGLLLRFGLIWTFAKAIQVWIQLLQPECYVLLKKRLIAELLQKENYPTGLWKSGDTSRKEPYVFPFSLKEKKDVFVFLII